MRPFPWDEAMQFGFGVLGHSPETFWRMTPRELAQAIRSLRGDALRPPDRATLAALMARFPDEAKNGG